MKIYGVSDQRDILEPQLMWATPRQRGFPPRGSEMSSVGGSSYSATSHVGSSYAGSPYAYSQPTSTQRNVSNGMLTQAKEEGIKKQQEALHKAAELKQMLTSLEKVDDEGRRASLLDTLCSSDDILNLPVHPNPPGIASGELVVDLLKHQVPYLLFCIPDIFPCIINRVKLCSGALNTSTQIYQPKNPTSRSSSGDTARQVIR